MTYSFVRFLKYSDTDYNLFYCKVTYLYQICFTMQSKSGLRNADATESSDPDFEWNWVA